MSVLAKAFNVAWRTVQAFVPALAKCDDTGAAAVLTEAEMELYRGMDVRDRAHAALVVRRLLRLRPEASRDLLAAAWLHDVGKSVVRFNPLHRIAAHILPPDTGGGQQLDPGLRGARQLAARHEAIGAGLLERAGSHRAASIIASLATEAWAGDPEVAALRAADEAT